jgi:hypothetical protein
MEDAAMRYLALPLVLSLAACGSSGAALDGGSDVALAEGGADALGTDAPPSDAAPADAMPPGDVQRADVAPDVPADTTSGCVDADHDGYGAMPCGNDCNDNDPAIHPGAMELCDGIDQNCDGVADTNGDPALNTYCMNTAPTPPNPPGIWNGVMPTCRYPGDALSAGPVTAVTCEASYSDSRAMPHFVCWHVAGATIACPMP